MSFSKLDIVYRSILLSKYFIKGWGNPEDLIRLIKFRKVVAERQGDCYKLIPDVYPVTITNEFITNNAKIIDGYFLSPFDLYLPDLLPTESKNAHFQMILPRKWHSNQFKPVCLHMAGTGDHYFWRRRELLAKPLVQEGGVASIILENPFYGLRKPRGQVRSILHHVSDIFVMGGCLMMEAIVLFHWCKRLGYGPLGVTGISMGGHMASLAASSWPYPVVLVPCLSWSTASGVFTKGVMSRAINWSLLRHQYQTIDAYRTKVAPLIQRLPPERLTNVESVGSVAANISQPEVQTEAQLVKPVDLSVMVNEKRLKIENVFVRRLLHSNSLPSYINRVLGITSNIDNKKTEISNEEVINFMKILMDEFTHLNNFPSPVDTSLVVNVCALCDAYVPRNGVTDLTHIWPGMSVRYLNGGHISAFVLHQKAFRDAIIEGFKIYQRKYGK